MSMQEVREQNIALVTQTALACFVENGIEKTTIRDIAQHAGLTERSVYRYFAGKDELVIAAAYLYWDRAKELAAQSLAKQRRRGMTGIEEIRVLLRSYAGLIFTASASRSTRRSRCATPAGSTRSSTARRSAMRSPPARSQRPSAAASPTGRSTPTPMSKCSTITPTTRSSASSSVCPSACRVCTSSTGTRASTRCASSSRAHSRRRPSNKGTGNTF